MTANKWLIFIIMGITLAYAGGRKSRSNKKHCIQLITVILTCFSGFRSWQMGDVFHYCYAYLECNMPDWKLDITSRDTIGLQLFFRATGQLGISFELCLLIIAAFVAITIGILVYKYSPSPYWSYVIYIAMGFYISSFNVLKQVIAMGFVILAMVAIIERKPIRFVFWVIIAAFFHFPALIFLVAYPFANKKIDAGYFLIVIAMIAVVFVFRDQIVQQATEVYYIDDMTFTADEAIGFKAIFMVLILIFALMLRPLRRYDLIYRQVFSVMILAAIVQSFSVYDNVFSRLADYFYQFVVLFIPLMLQSGKEQARDYPDQISEIRSFGPNVYGMIQFCITVFAVLYYFNYINNSSALLSQFHFFWQS